MVALFLEQLCLCRATKEQRVFDDKFAPHPHIPLYLSTPPPRSKIHTAEKHVFSKLHKDFLFYIFLTGDTVSSINPKLMQTDKAQRDRMAYNITDEHHLLPVPVQVIWKSRKTGAENWRC